MFMIDIIKYLKWDSAFFKKNIYELRGVSSLPYDILRDLDFDLVYIFSNDKFISESISDSLFDVKLVDRKVTYVKTIKKPNYDVNFSILSYDKNYPVKELFELAYASGIYSRFRIDKRIENNDFKRLYSEWIVNSVNKKLADEVLVIKQNNKISGFLTIKGNKNKAIIGLIAVDKKYRGLGLGKELIFAAESWAFKNKYKYIEVATQEANEQANYFYSKCGYEIETSVYIYHLRKIK